MKDKYNNIVQTLDKAANKMRGNGVKSSDYYNVLLSLIFIKFITSKAQKDFENSKITKYEEFVDKSKYHSEWTIVDEQYLWKNIKKSNKDIIKQNIDRAYKSLEKYNPDFSNISIYNFTSNEIKSGVVLKLIEEIEKSFSYEKTKYIDLFGAIYEYFIGKYSSEAKRAGEFYTPYSVVKLMTHAIENNAKNNNSGIEVYDPTCGSGGMLIQSMSFLKEKGIKEENMQFFGQELQGETWKIAKMNLSLRNSSFKLGKKNANSFSEDLFKDQKFDFILSNPPFNMNFFKEDYEHITEDKNRFKYGRIFGKGQANYMFFQHVISHLKEKGIGAVVMHAAAGTDSKTIHIRKEMLKDNIVESIILLPSNIFTNTSIQSTIWIFNKNKLNNNILFVDLQNSTNKIKTQEVIPDSIILEVDKIMTNFRSNKKIQTKIPFSIKDNEILLEMASIPLSPSRFIIKKEIVEKINKNDVINDLKKSLLEIEEIKNDVEKVIHLLKQDNF